jgi:hypothetical protein
VEPYETQRRRKDDRLVDVQLSVSRYMTAAERSLAPRKSPRTSRRERRLNVCKRYWRAQSLRQDVFATVIAIAKQTLGREGTGRDDRRLPRTAHFWRRRTICSRIGTGSALIF